MTTERLINRAVTSLSAGMPVEDLVKRIAETEDVEVSEAYLAVMAGKILVKDMEKDNGSL